MESLRIGVIGGIPRVLGGGGLEHQIDVTIAALERRGHSAERVADIDPDDPPQLMHSFGNGADVWQQLRHWRKNRLPLVSSPIIVCNPGRSERSLRIGAMLGQRIPNVNSMTQEIVQRADTVVALTEYERSVVGRLAPETRVRVIGNGVEPVEPAAENPVPNGDPYVVLLGTVTPRKRQIDAIATLGKRHRLVVVGGLDSSVDRSRFEALAANHKVTWTGEIADQSTVRRIVTDAKALLLFSEAEGLSLAVLEALACGTPAVTSELPSNIELAKAHPGWVQTARSLDQAGEILERLERPNPTTQPKIPDWDAIAGQLEDVYRELLAGSAGRR